MWLVMASAGIAAASLLYALEQREKRVSVERELYRERSTTETLGRLNGQLRTRLDEAQRRLAEIDAGTPGPSSRRIRKGAQQ